MKYYNIKISNEIVEDKELSCTAKWLYVVLAAEQNRTKEKEFLFTNEKLMEVSGLSHNTLDKVRKELIEKNYIRKQRKSIFSEKHGIKSTTHYCFYTVVK